MPLKPPGETASVRPNCSTRLNASWAIKSKSTASTVTVSARDQVCQKPDREGGQHLGQSGIGNNTIVRSLVFLKDASVALPHGRASDTLSYPMGYRLFANSRLTAIASLRLNRRSYRAWPIITISTPQEDTATSRFRSSRDATPPEAVIFSPDVSAIMHVCSRLIPVRVPSRWMSV